MVKNYTENDVKEAVKAENEGRMSLREAEQFLNVPKSTINRSLGLVVRSAKIGNVSAAFVLILI